MNSRLVYDSDAPLQKPARAAKVSKTPASASLNLNLPNDGVVRLLRDRKGRGGKTVTLVAGVSGSPAALNALASDLKRLCGTGGTVRGELIEIQGDVRERIKSELERRGYTVKLAGG
ncbi:MAG: stress response translation initiation inhibitor YciH [Chloroflexi bacterium]|nr:stress response translation initiation inhibitor YciH [Chloroflexota bacterium]MBV9596685.1 stress response translation initiation inhibitor YciH [Chloroflexota bacterium]